MIALVQGADLLHFFVGEGEIPDLEVLLDALLVGGLGNDHNAPLHVPAENHLANTLPMSCRNALEHGVVEGLVAAAAQRRPSFGDDVVILHGLQSVLLGEVGVQLHLVYHGTDFHGLAEVGENVRIEIADANGLQLALPIGVLHGPPSAEVVLHSLVQQIQVQILQAGLFQRGVNGSLGGIVILHVLHPHLGGDEQLLPGADTLGNRLPHSLAYGVLVGVGGGGVDQPVARLDGLQYRAFALFFIPHLKDSKALHGHFSSVLQRCVFHGWSILSGISHSIVFSIIVAWVFPWRKSLKVTK